MKFLPFERKAKDTESFFRIPRKLQYFIDKYKKRLRIKRDQDFIYYILVEYIRQKEKLTNEELVEIRKSILKVQNWKKLTHNKITKKVKQINAPKNPIF